MVFQKGHKKVPLKKTPVKKAPAKKQREESAEEDMEQDIKDTLEENDDNLLELEQEHEEESVFVQLKHTKPQDTEDVKYESLEDQLKQHAMSQDPSANPVITEPDGKTLEQLEMMREIEKKEKIASNTGKVIHYPANPPSVQKETNENITNQIINALMSNQGYSFMEAKAEVQITTKSMTLEEMRDKVLKGEIKKRVDNIVEKGIQIKTMQSNIKYY